MDQNISDLIEKYPNHIKIERIAMLSDILNRFKKCQDNILRAILCVETLEGSNDPKVLSKLDDTYAANIFKAITDSLKADIILSLSRIIEKSKTDRCSIKRIIEIYRGRCYKK